MLLACSTEKVLRPSFKGSNQTLHTLNQSLNTEVDQKANRLLLANQNR